MSQEKIDALRQAVNLSPENHPLRLILADALVEAGQTAVALPEYQLLLDADALPNQRLIPIGKLALQQNNLALASDCLNQAIGKGIVEGITELRSAIEAQKEADGFQKLFAPTQATNETTEALPSLTPQEEVITFADVGGLADVKKVIHKMIILPFLKPKLYKLYGRKSGGGVLMYGPPGCGKTMLAKATAGECQLPFINIRIEQILDPYLGVSERNLHRIFQQARAYAPCVIFIDELDAIGYARRKQGRSAGRSLVDQLLQELDSIGSENDNLLILAATNAPWDIDDALMRPGRFDRRVFVSPPDAEARQAILKLITEPIPHEKLNYKQLAKSTPLFSGADLDAFVHQAIDNVIDEALETGEEPPLQMRHFNADLRPTTLDWLNRAQNFVEFANSDKRYDAVAKYLRSREVKKWHS